MHFRSVDSPHYHIWTDALHARRLARSAHNEWDRGTYVRWGIASAWTAFEAACLDATGVPGLGMRFKDRLNEAFAKIGVNRPDWGKKPWQSVARIYDLRIEYVHASTTQDRLFAPVSELDDAITVLRSAIKAVYGMANKPVPDWPDDDEDFVVGGDSAHATVIGAGAEGPAAIRIAYVMRGKEFTHEIRAAASDPELLMDRLLKGLNVPVSHIRAYRGEELVDEWKLNMRGS